MRRALPSIATTLAIVGLLAAAVIASPDEPREQPRSASGPFGLLRDRPTELEPEFDRYEAPPPATPGPPLEPLRDLAPDEPRGPSRAIGRPWAGRLQNGVELPAWGVGFVTFDSALRKSPSRGWRRWGTYENVART